MISSHTESLKAGRSHHIISIAKKIVLATCLLLGSFVSHAHANNALKNHPSPYLAMHGDDPVQWREWGQGAIDEARKHNRILFISSGYFSCHWCHVMQRESFADEEVASLLNRHFIPVKIDRELLPALDAYLINFVERTRGAAGWPLNTFLTPEGYPLTGLVYAPRENFLAILERLMERWGSESDQLKVLAENAFLTMQEAGEVQAEVIDSAEIDERFKRYAFAMANDLQGGFGDQNQFPMVPQLDALLELYRVNQDDDLAELLLLSLDQMAEKGLRDHLAGGFFRYTVDPAWEIPHYEKMLYTQALMMRLYLKAGQLFARDDYIAVAVETANFVLDRMSANGGGYISSLSAVDAEGEEGGSYLWDSAQLQEVLAGDERETVARFWGLNIDGKSEQLPMQLVSLDEVSVALDSEVATVKRLLEEGRTKLLAQRETRLPPADTKQLAGWNGLLLTALSELATATAEPRYRDAAIHLANWLSSLWNGKVLYRSTHGPRLLGDASLEDYAYVAEGLKAVSTLAGNQEWRRLSETIVETAWRLFFSEKGWRLADAMLIPGLAGEGALQGAPMPAPSAVILSLSDQPAKLQKANRLAAAKIADEPFWYPDHVTQLRRYEEMKDE